MDLNTRNIYMLLPQVTKNSNNKNEYDLRSSFVDNTPWKYP